MFDMNTKGKQRKNPLTYYEKLIESKFDSVRLYQNVIKKASSDQKKRIVNYLSFKKIKASDLSNDYFVGLIVGDGSFGCEFDMRQGRKVTIRKTLSVSLGKTLENEKLLDLFANFLGIKWTKRTSILCRHSFSIYRIKDIERVQCFFILHKELLPVFKQKDLYVWCKVTLLKNLLKKTQVSQNFLEQKRAYSLIKEIYFVHYGIYRKYSLDEVLNRFTKDYFSY